MRARRNLAFEQAKALCAMKSCMHGSGSEKSPSSLGKEKACSGIEEWRISWWKRTDWAYLTVWQVSDA